MSLARVKNWVAEVLTFSDLNAEFNNILNNPGSLITPITFNLTFTDATYDIGASGATRPRNLYLSGTATVDTIVSAGTTATVFNTVATTVNAFGAASVALTIGHASAAATFPGGVKSTSGLMTVTTAAAATSSLTISRTVNTASTWEWYLPIGGTDIRLYNGTDRIIVNATGGVTIASLAGAGSRTVVVDANGLMSAP